VVAFLIVLLIASVLSRYAPPEGVAYLATQKPSFPSGQVVVSLVLAAAPLKTAPR
jgi:hypothetical protein